MSTNHPLKTLAPFWDAQAAGFKNFEIRYNDRGFATGDTLELHRLPGEGEDTTKPAPAPLLRRVTYVLPGGLEFGGRALLTPSAVIMSTVPVYAAATVEKLDNQMVAHLVETLRNVRQFAKDHLVPHAATTEIMRMIDEAIDT